MNGERDRSKEVVFEGLSNVDPITGLPYETGGARRYLIEETRQALNQGTRVFFLEIDLNQLKDLNKKYGHEGGNQAIKAFAEEKIRALMESGEIAFFYFYRPQAGGDEYKVVMVAKEEEEIAAKMREEIEIEIDGKKVSLSGSVGMAEAKGKEEAGELSFEEAGKVFEEMEREAGKRLDEGKTKGKEEERTKMIEDVGTGTAEEIEKRLANLLSSNRRFTEEEILSMLTMLRVTARAEGRREGMQRR